MNGYRKITSAQLVVGGNVIRQGDHFTQGYVPRDYKNAKVDLTGKNITVSLYRKQGVRYEAPAAYNATTGIVSYTVN